MHYLYVNVYVVLFLVLNKHTFSIIVGILCSTLCLEFGIGSRIYWYCQVFKGLLTVPIDFAVCPITDLTMFLQMRM